MPTWSGILAELQQAIAAGDPGAFDHVRRKYLALLHQHTRRDTILYATAWTQPGSDVPPALLSITDEDLQGLMEVIHGLKGPALDLILHSPGGIPEAAEAIVSYLRSKFDHVRVIVPNMAMSAATMIACSANVIAMGKHSFIGPIDPQVVLPGGRAAPAQAILDQFDLAKDECKRDSSALGAWVPMLGQYGPALLVQCKNALKLSEELVSEWLERYMLAGQTGAKARATDIAKKLCDHKTHKTHGRHIQREQAKALGLVVEDLETDQAFQDLVLSVFHASTHTFGVGVYKIIENHSGKAFIKQLQRMVQTIPVPPSRLVPHHTLPPTGSP